MMSCLLRWFSALKGENLFFGAPSQTPYEYFGIGLNATGLFEPVNGGATTTAGSVNLGTELWSNTLQPPTNNLTVLWAGIDPVTNVFVLNYRETVQFVGFSLLTGKQIWGPTTPQAPLDYYGSDGSGSISDTIAYGNIYSSAYAGIVYCYRRQPEIYCGPSATAEKATAQTLVLRLHSVITQPS